MVNGHELNERGTSRPDPGCYDGLRHGGSGQQIRLHIRYRSSGEQCIRSDGCCYGSRDDSSSWTVPGYAAGSQKKVYKRRKKEAGKAASVLGISFITEGAIPFAAADPLRVIPSIMVGSAVTGALSMAFGATLRAPHGGIFVLPIPHAVEQLGLYALSIVIGTFVTAIMISVLKKKQSLKRRIIKYNTGSDSNGY